MTLLPLLLLSCGPDQGPEKSTTDADSSDEGLAWAVDAAGPFHAGYRTAERVYEPGGGASTRTIALNLWYPTEETSGEAPRYTVGAPDTGAFLDASLAPAVYAGGYPVLAYSHGAGAYGGASADLCRYFASHGWVVIAPEHTGSTAAEGDVPLSVEQYFERPLDIRESLDALEQLHPSDPLAGAVDTRAVLLAGHSFGAYTTWAAGGTTFDPQSVVEWCRTSGPCGEEELSRFDDDLSDPRVAAILPMAGTLNRALFGRDGEEGIGIPVLFMSGGEDEVGQQTQWDNMEGVDFTWVDIAGGCHQAFAGGGCEHLDTDEGFRVVDTYALALGRSAVLGDASVAGILDGTETVSELVTFQRKVP